MVPDGESILLCSTLALSGPCLFFSFHPYDRKRLGKILMFLQNQ